VGGEKSGFSKKPDFWERVTSSLAPLTQILDNSKLPTRLLKPLSGLQLSVATDEARTFWDMMNATLLHRIVPKIDRLMALCDRLEQQIDAATERK
jgi:hypothetical protein